jgi:hypothetical protein
VQEKKQKETNLLRILYTPDKEMALYCHTFLLYLVYPRLNKKAGEILWNFVEFCSQSHTLIRCRKTSLLILVVVCYLVMRLNQKNIQLMFCSFFRMPEQQVQELKFGINYSSK